ncbi:hypothetical protein EDD85DRAFT_955691 [Armillaria nabsnona]|nr:hypothetical protein EDD85DRAFT_955691 [Armillaria nabsnona]
MSSPGQTPASQSTGNDRRDRILHLLAVLFAELDTVAPGIVPPGASLSVPSSPLPVPDDDEGEEPPTFACLNCSFLNNPAVHNPNKFYAVTQGWAVGVVCGRSVVFAFLFVQPTILNGRILSAAQRSLTDGVAGGHASKGSSKREAVETFNCALLQTQVKVVPKTLKL